MSSKSCKSQVEKHGQGLDRTVLIHRACNRLNKKTHKNHKTNTAIFARHFKWQHCSSAATLSRLSMAGKILPKLIISWFHGSPAIPSSRRRLVLCLILLHNAAQLNMMLQCPMEPSCESALPGLHHACLFFPICGMDVTCLYSHSPNCQTAERLISWICSSRIDWVQISQ